MTRQRLSACVAVACLLGAVNLRAQSSLGGDANNGAGVSVVPRVIKFSGEINPQATQVTPTKESEGAKNLLLTVVGVTFSFYELQEGGSPLWSEAQKVQVDAQGRYTVLLGATEVEGLPLDLFASGKALWLGVQPQLPGAVEQPRVLLVAVPYALKAADSDTLGGKPASAYALAGAPTLVTAAVSASSSSFNQAGAPSTNPTPGLTMEKAASATQPKGPCSSVTADGSAAAHQVAVYSAACALAEDAGFVDVGGKVGIGTSAPSSPFQVVGRLGRAAQPRRARTRSRCRQRPTSGR